MRDILATTLGWFCKAFPTPTSKNFHTQLGCHLEEVGEMLDTLSSDAETRHLISDAQVALKHLADHLKASDNVVWVENEDDAEFLDAICDQIVTAAGVGHMAQLPVLPAMAEVNRSNFSKFDPETGEPIYNDNMKVMKGPAYTKPDLLPFVQR